MFYSEALLSKTGPLARVWLSANLERKLSKTHILQSSVKDSVDAIVNPSQAPMALRLSGQLLLGVVRIYSRKTRYLLDDCNEALLKIKMAFRLSSNNDIPAGLQMPSRDALMLPDVLTEGDNLEIPPLPDASFLLPQDSDDIANRRRRAASHDINLAEDFSSSQYLQSSILEKNPYGDEELALDDDLDLGLDLGLDIVPTSKADISVEMGRDAPPPRPFADDIGDSDLNIFTKDGHSLIGERQHSVQVSIADHDEDFRIDEDGDVNMGGAEHFTINDGPDAPLSTSAGLARGRISESPLSDIDPNLERDLEVEHQGYLDTTLFEPFDETEQSIKRNATNRSRKVRILQADNETVIPSAVIKAQQQDHSKILRPQTFLPRDPSLYALMEMQRNGGFVSNIIGGARCAAWAPELRGMLSLDAIAKSRELKRKHDSGITDVEEQDSRVHKSPKLALNVGDDVEFGDTVVDAGTENLPAGDQSIVEPASDGFQPQSDEAEGFDEVTIRPQSKDGSDVGDTPRPNFDETMAPLIHPADNGPVSIGTKHAVHLLRDCFGADAEHSPSKRKNACVVFQELLPEATTSRSDATKMFFEVLVLATKDAIKVEQKEGALGGPIRVRGKRGLWGSWAEREAGGEIAGIEAQAVTATPAEA